MIDPRTSEHDIKHYVDEVDSKYMFVVEDEVVLKKIYNIADRTTLKKIIKISPLNSLNDDKKNDKTITLSGIEICNFNSFIEEGNTYKLSTKAEYVENRPVVIEHTGGTTGVPKGVLLSDDAINMIAHHFIISDLKFTREQKWLNIMPTFIAYGVGNGLHLPLTIGMCVVEIPKFEPDKIDELIALYEPNNFTGVPIHYESIINSDKLEHVDFSSWVLPGVGGDSMDIQLELEANEFMKKHNASTDVIKGYGLTEVCAAACVSF